MSDTYSLFPPFGDPWPSCYLLSLSSNDPSPSPRSGFSVASGTQCNRILFTNGIGAGMGREHRPQPISARHPPQWKGEKGHVTSEGLIRVKFTSGVRWWGERDAPEVNSIVLGTVTGILVPIREARGPSQHMKKGRTKSITEKWSRNPNETVYENWHMASLRWITFCLQPRTFQLIHQL